MSFCFSRIKEVMFSNVSQLMEDINAMKEGAQAEKKKLDEVVMEKDGLIKVCNWVFLFDKSLVH